MNFARLVEKTLSNTTKTENGAISNKSTLSAVLDYFAKCSAMRGHEEDAIELFDESFKESDLLTMKILFYSRDIRGGQGERSTFRKLLEHIATKHPEKITANFANIAKYGRWDDFYSFVETGIEQEAFEFLNKQLQQDLKDCSEQKSISLLAKWLKSENTSSPESKRLAKSTRNYFRMNSETYRKTLSKLRKYINIVESKMSNSSWDEIDYSKVPARALKGHTRAFNKHDSERFSQYLKDVSQGKAKINTGTLYPYDIVNKLSTCREMSKEEEQAYELMWKNLPNYFNDGEYNTLAVVDVSGSMESGCSDIRPIDVAISLGIYMAEKNKGILNGYFMTFSEDPQMVKLCGNSLREKIHNMCKSSWGFNTNILNVFSVLLKTIIANKIPENEVPKKLFIISDMQFDEASPGDMETTFEKIDKLYRKHNIKRPDLIFWNVNARPDVPVLKDDYGTFLVSGASPSILSHALNTESQTPYEFMLEVLNSERYSSVV